MEEQEEQAERLLTELIRGRSIQVALSLAGLLQVAASAALAEVRQEELVLVVNGN
jgi:hypothetical protein